MELLTVCLFVEPNYPNHPNYPNYPNYPNHLGLFQTISNFKVIQILSLFFITHFNSSKKLRNTLFAKNELCVQYIPKSMWQYLRKSCLYSFGTKINLIKL